MSTIIISIFVVLFVLGFAMLLVIATRLHNDYDEKLKHIANTQEYIVDTIKEQQDSHTINVNPTDVGEELPDDVSTIKFKSKV